MASLSEIVSYTDRFLRIRDVGDWDNALNGLQIENSGRVTRIGAAVDVSTRVLTEAQKQDVDLLIVHHGLFWPGLQPIQGALRRQLRIAFENDVALYSAHLTSRYPSESRQQRTARRRARTKIRATVPGRKRPAGRLKSSRLAAAQRTRS